MANCKIICAKCGKPILYDWRDIAFYPVPESNNIVYVTCIRKGCEHRNHSDLFKAIFSAGCDYGRSAAKREIRESLGD